MLKGKWACFETKEELKNDVDELIFSRPLITNFLMELMNEFILKMDAVSLSDHPKTLNSDSSFGMKLKF